MSSGARVSSNYFALAIWRIDIIYICSYNQVNKIKLSQHNITVWQDNMTNSLKPSMLKS